MTLIWDMGLKIILIIWPYFLGKSLFSDDGGTKYDTIFTEGVRYLSSKNEKLEQINFENDVVYEISGYLSFAKK